MTDYALIPLSKVQELLQSVEIHGKLITGVLNDLKLPAKRKERKRKHGQYVFTTFYIFLTYFLFQTSEFSGQGRQFSFQNQKENHQKTPIPSLPCRKS